MNSNGVAKIGLAIGNRLSIIFLLIIIMNNNDEHLKELDKDIEEID